MAQTEEIQEKNLGMISVLMQFELVIKWIIAPECELNSPFLVSLVKDFLALFLGSDLTIDKCYSLLFVVKVDVTVLVNLLTKKDLTKKYAASSIRGWCLKAFSIKCRYVFFSEEINLYIPSYYTLLVR